MKKKLKPLNLKKQTSLSMWQLKAIKGGSTTYQSIWTIDGTNQWIKDTASSDDSGSSGGYV